MSHIQWTFSLIWFLRIRRTHVWDLKMLIWSEPSWSSACCSDFSFWLTDSQLGIIWAEVVSVFFILGNQPLCFFLHHLCWWMLTNNLFCVLTNKTELNLRDLRALMMFIESLEQNRNSETNATKLKSKIQFRPENTRTNWTESGQRQEPGTEDRGQVRQNRWLQQEQPRRNRKDQKKETIPSRNRTDIKDKIINLNDD